LSNDEKQLYVKLSQCDKHEDIHLMVVDKNGDTIKGGHLLTLDQDLKCVVIADNINPDIPLKTGIYDDLLFITEEEYRIKMANDSRSQFVSLISQGIKESFEESEKKVH